ncbi:MAG: gas vesicle protein [Leptolyngbya sp. SIOISBB]|nr:gas vesicle protein [Leptolyngbya sp. SIOISBB]
MSFSRPPSRINPKISTMPRQQSESSHYLSIYKLTVEKKRLQQELDSLAKRRTLLQNRLAALEQEMIALNGQAQALGETSATPQLSLSEPNSIVYPPATPGTTDPYKTVTLDY